MGQLQAGIIPVTAFQQNCTILFDSEDKHGVLIDPGGDNDQVLRMAISITPPAPWT
jgi:hydroxyacylglutathione hydrolase